MDAGRLPDGTSNWWRMILRGKLRSKGRTFDGVAMNQFAILYVDRFVRPSV